MSQIPTILAEITFLTLEEGGRAQVPDLSSGNYMPHLVVQSLDVRQANRSTEDYLGVCFLQGPAEYATRRPLRCRLALIYHPQVDYASLQSGATFTIREGPNVVGFGVVLTHTEPGATDV